jgi:hypothetical protein
VLVLRWLFDDTRTRHQLARDNAIGWSTAYAYRDEAIGVLDARKPSLGGALLGGALLAAKAARHLQVVLDGTLIPDLTQIVDLEVVNPG